MDRLCVFSCERPLNPTRGISNLSPAIVLQIFADHLRLKKLSKTGKRRALAADQQDIFTVRESICYCEWPLSATGCLAITVLALKRWDIPLFLICSALLRGTSGKCGDR